MFGAYRTLLALMVVTLHYAKVPYVGQYAVFGFFLLSGYLMTLIMQQNYGYAPRGVAAYLLNRFLRIYPLYWICCGISLLILLTLDTRYTSGFNFMYDFPNSWRGWVRNLGLILEYRTQPVLISPAWALTVELFFYAAIGAGLSRNRQITLAWLAGSIGYTGWLLANGAEFGVRYHTIGAASLPFSAGATIYHWRSELRAWLGPVATHRLAPAALCCALVLNWLLAAKAGVLATWGYYANFLICAAAVVSLCRRSELPGISQRVDKWLGDLSYPIYLIHFPLGFFFLYAFREWFGWQFTGPSPGFLAVALLPLLLVTWLLAAVVEKPVELLRDLVKQAK